MGVAIVYRAQVFATKAHSNQPLPNKARSPFIEHPAEVALLVALADGSPEEVASAWLHDVEEDTDVTNEDIQDHFGKLIAEIVDGLTDKPVMKDMPLLERKTLQAERVRDKSHSVKLVKLADQTANLRMIVNDPPTGWKKEKCRDYIEGARRVAEACREASEFLYDLFLDAHDLAKAKYS